MEEAAPTTPILDQDFAHLLLDSMADGVFTLNEKGVISSWNPSMERITGYTAGEALGKSCMFLGFSRCFRKTCPTGIVECGILKESVRDRSGRFEDADGGTLFLDEIGEISPYIQVKLPRVLQEREIERVGESRKRKVDIRVIAATHQDLYEMVQDGRFRQDLYYRLKVFPIHLPPLRKRKEDIPILISHFIRDHNEKTGKRIAGVSHSAMRILMDYTWPGNVRELENAIEHAFVLCDTDYMDIFDLPVEIRQYEYQPGGLPAPGLDLRGKRGPGKTLTRETLVKILHESNWNKAEAGRRLSVSRTAVWQYMKKWDIPLKQPS